MNKNLNPFIIKMENSIKEAMVKIKKNGTRTLFVVKNNNINGISNSIFGIVKYETFCLCYINSR